MQRSVVAEQCRQSRRRNQAQCENGVDSSALLELPCHTTGATGLGEGDPLSFVIVGAGVEVGNALIRAGWDET